MAAVVAGPHGSGESEATVTNFLASLAVDSNNIDLDDPIAKRGIGVDSHMEQTTADSQVFSTREPQKA